MTQVNGKRSGINWSVFLLGFGAGVFITALVAASRVLPVGPAAASAAHLDSRIERSALMTPLTRMASRLLGYRDYLDIVSAEIIVGDRGVLSEGRSSGEVAEGEEEVRVAVVDIKMADLVPAAAGAKPDLHVGTCD